MIENKFAQVMQERSNEELLRIIVEQKENYQPEAVQAAELELKTRNIATSQMDGIVAENKAQKEEIDRRANARLELIFKIMAFLLPGGSNSFWLGAMPLKAMKEKRETCLGGASTDLFSTRY